MNTARLYLWKEWREQRRACVAVFCVLPMLFLAISLTMPEGFINAWAFLTLCGLLALATTLTAVGGELIAGERRMPGRWLERLPCGMGSAFGAKLAFLLVSSLLSIVYGVALGAVIGPLGEIRIEAGDLRFVNELGGLLVFLGLALATWTFAASAWCERGVIALFCGAILVTGPLYAAWQLAGAGYRSSPGEVAFAAVTLLVAGVAGAWGAFVHGHRFGRGTLSAAWRGIGATALCLLPVGIIGLERVWARDTIDLVSASTRVGEGWVFDDGRHAVVTLACEGPKWNVPTLHVLEVDLQDGEWRSLATSASLSHFWDGQGPPLSNPSVLFVDKWSSHDDLSLDARTGAAFTEPMETWLRPSRFAGHGWHLRGDTKIFDPYSRKAMGTGELGPHRVTELAIGPHGWLFEDRTKAWYEYDPVTGTLETAAWFEEVAKVGPMLADGRIFVTRRVPHGTIALADLRDGSLTDTGQFLLDTFSTSSPYRRDFYRPGEPILLDTGSGRFLFDLEKDELVPADDSWAGRVLRCMPDGSLILVGEEGIVRRDPQSGEREVLFAIGPARLAP